MYALQISQLKENVLIAQNITAKLRKTLNSNGDLANITYKFIPMKCLKYNPDNKNKTKCKIKT
jgi:predicted flavoprotein YhiN